MNFYNDIDDRACAWTQELITAGQIAPGVVDCRSITDIDHDLSQFTQAHFFNGISGWSRALDLAGWSRYRPVWCASLPCQSFSCAGNGEGFEDERGGLWHPFRSLVRKYRPRTIFGEQVKAAIGHYWLDRIFTDLEAEGYACGAAVLGAHSAGAPHIRQRIYWVASWVGFTDSAGWEPRQHGAAPARHGDTIEPAGGFGRLAHPEHDGGRADEQERQAQGRAADGRTCGLADMQRTGLEGLAGNGDHGDQPGRDRAAEARPVAAGGCSGDVRLGDSASWEQWGQRKSREIDGRQISAGGSGSGSWNNFDIIPCRDGKARRIESGTFPLVAGLPRGVVPSGDPSISEAQASAESRVARLRGYGNSIVPQLAAEFIQASMEALNDL